MEFLKCFSKGFFWFFWYSNRDCNYQYKKKEELETSTSSLIQRYKRVNDSVLQLDRSERRDSGEKIFGSTLKQWLKTMDVLLMKLLSNSLKPCKQTVNYFSETNLCLIILQSNADGETDLISSSPFSLCASKVCYGQNSTTKWMFTVCTYSDDALWSTAIQNEVRFNIIYL